MLSRKPFGGAIGFEPNPLHSFQPFAGLGWQPKDRNGSQRNNYWTRIGHCRFVSSVANLPAKSAGLVTFQADRLRLAHLVPLNSGHSPTDPLTFRGGRTCRGHHGVGPGKTSARCANRRDREERNRQWRTEMACVGRPEPEGSTRRTDSRRTRQNESAKSTELSMKGVFCVRLDAEN